MKPIVEAISENGSDSSSADEIEVSKFFVNPDPKIDWSSTCRKEDGKLIYNGKLDLSMVELLNI